MGTHSIMITVFYSIRSYKLNILLHSCSIKIRSQIPCKNNQPKFLKFNSLADHPQNAKLISTHQSISKFRRKSLPLEIDQLRTSIILFIKRSINPLIRSINKPFLLSLLRPRPKPNRHLKKSSMIELNMLKYISLNSSNWRNEPRNKKTQKNQEQILNFQKLRYRNGK